MGYQTSNSITNTKSTVFDSNTDGAGPIEWEFTASGGDINLYFTGVFPGPTTPVVVYDGQTHRRGSMARGITKIEADTTTTATLTLRPRFD